ncbi:Ribulose bisphosphate carboxylase large chain [Lithohypha guttulata]|nr:Ribulose bisphosphate carboxylase large chain [Lithohypha guttulata]
MTNIEKVATCLSFANTLDLIRPRALSITVGIHLIQHARTDSGHFWEPTSVPCSGLLSTILWICLRFGGLSETALTAIIASKGKSSNPLHRRQRTNDEDEATVALTSAVEEKERSERQRSYSSATESDEFSLWSDTGDIAEELANDRDHPHIELDPLNSEGRPLNARGHGGGRGKKVVFEQQDYSRGEKKRSGIAKEDITIPSPPSRRISTAEKVLALIMAPSDPQTARSRGLVGKPLL